MMTSLVLLVPIVVSMTAAASLQQILDDRLISESKDIFAVSPETELDSFQMDSRRSSRRHPTNGDAIETKTSQFSVGIAESRLSTTPWTLATSTDLSVFNKVRRPLNGVKSQSDFKAPSDVHKSENDANKSQSDVNKSSNDASKSENDVNNLQMKTRQLENVAESSRSSVKNNNGRNVQSNVKSVQSNVKNSNPENGQRNVKNTQRNVKNIQRNVKNSQRNVKNTYRTIKNTQSNVQNNVKTIANNVETPPNNVETANNLSTLQNNVETQLNNVKTKLNNGKTTSDKIETTPNNVKAQNNLKTAKNNVKTTSNNVKTSSNNVGTTPDNVKAPNNEKLSQNNVKTTSDNVETTSNNVKTPNNLKTTQNNVQINQKSPNLQSNVENTQNTKVSDNVNKPETSVKDLHPSQTSTEKSVSKVRPTTKENDAPKGKVSKRNRKTKGFYFSYPYVPQIRHHYPQFDTNFEDCNYGVGEERTPGGKTKFQDSNIYYIKLPPTPYMFIPGLGYVSQPPRYSPPSSPLSPPVRPFRPARPPTIYQPHVNPFIKVPIDFISNGKPTSVYQWQDGKLPARPENQITNLDKGPYVFNGRPSSVYLLRPDGSQTIPQPIMLHDYQNNGYYSSATFD